LDAEEDVVTNGVAELVAYVRGFRLGFTGVKLSGDIFRLSSAAPDANWCPV
jgi:hypothetical protein